MFKKTTSSKTDLMKIGFLITMFLLFDVYRFFFNYPLKVDTREIPSALANTCFVASQYIKTTLSESVHISNSGLQRINISNIKHLIDRQLLE